MKSTRMTKMMLKKHLGGEPEENSIVENIIPYLNYYSATYDRGDAIKFFENYMTMTDPEFLDRRSYEKLSTTVGWISRMKSLNVSLPVETEEWFKARINEMPARLTIVSNLAPINDPYYFKVIADIESKFDEMDFDFDYIHDLNLSKSNTEKIIEFFKRRLTEIDEIENDDQLIEAYSSFSDNEIDEIRVGLEKLMKVLGSNFTSNSRKARKLKVRSPEEIVKNIKLNMKDDELHLKSLSATKILGATTLVYYVPKHRSLQIFVTEPGKVFDVKGKSMINFDPEKCFSKAIRKPEIVATTFTGKNLKRILKEFDNLSTKYRPQRTALISDNHMLLGAF